MKSLAFASLIAAAPAHADSVVIDFTVEPTPAAHQPTQNEHAGLLVRFPEPKGKKCEIDRAQGGLGGELLPTITSARGAITRKGAQLAYLIDYCPLPGVKRTRRLLVLDGEKPVVDKQLPAGLHADELLAAVDIDGDGFSELVATETIYRGGRNVIVAYLVRPSDLKVLGTWTAIEHCTPGTFTEENRHRVTFASGRFRDVVTKRTCHYPP
jgi:hypothetical protein